jgi:hypothetical protein
MPVHKVDYGVTIIEDKIIMDPRLSIGAVGVFCRICVLTREESIFYEGWREAHDKSGIFINLEKAFPCVDGINEYITELEECGYIQKEKEVDHV